MALNDIIFIKGQGGLGRPLEGEDYISGLLLYSSTLPSGFTSSSRVKSVGSLAEAEALGIVGDYSDGTAAIGSYLVSNKGTDGDTINISVVGINAVGVATTYDLGTYTKVTADSTTALVATAIGAVINAGTYNHGFSASVGSSTVTITAPKRFGTFLNSGTPIVATIVGTIAGTPTQFSGGTVSKSAVWHYHISEFFRVQSKGQLFIGIYAVPSSYTFSEIQSIQDYAQGKIRQIGIFKDAAFSSSDLTAIQVVCNTLAGLHKPLSAIYAGNIQGTTDLTTLTNLATLTANNVSAVIGQDAAGQGNYLYVTQGKSITCLGATLGAVALAKVSDDIAWISKFNMSSGTELDTIAFANGTLVSSLSQSTLNTLDNNRYIFLIKYVGIAGSYFNDSHCAVAVTSDYAYIENNRTIDKAIRGIYSSLLPNLNSPLQLNADGTLQNTTVAYFTSQASVNLDEMIRQTELSAYQVLIDPTQNVLSTSNLTVSVKLVPIGVARQITVKIGFTLSI
jgi:hypothetical protein